MTISQHMQHSGDPATLATLLESYNEVKKVFDTYKEMLDHGNYHRARAASEKVSHRGTGELALIDFEVKEISVCLTLLQTLTKFSLV